MACSISSGITFACADKALVGGTQSYVYLANLSNIATTTYTSDVISGFTFGAAPGLYKFEIPKNSGSVGSELQRTEGGNVLYNHNVNFNITSQEQADALILEDLALSEVVAIVVDRNEKIKVYGLKNGLEVIANVQNSGTAAASVVLAQVQLQGQEKTLPVEFLDTDFTTSIATLEGYLV